MITPLAKDFVDVTGQLETDPKDESGVRDLFGYLWTGLNLCKLIQNNGVVLAVIQS